MSYKKSDRTLEVTVDIAKRAAPVAPSLACGEG